jgi:hypothetical protein
MVNIYRQDDRSCDPGLPGRTSTHMWSHTSLFARHAISAMQRQISATCNQRHAKGKWSSITGILGNQRHMQSLPDIQNKSAPCSGSVVLIRSRSPKIHAACLFSNKGEQKSHTRLVPIGLPPIRNHSAPSLLAHSNLTTIRRCLVQRRCRLRASLHDRHAESGRRSGVRALCR